MNQLLLISYPATDVRAARKFYKLLLGADLAPTLTDNIESFHAYVATGVKLALNKRQYNEQGAIAHFNVENLTYAIKSLTENGGKLIAGPYEIPVAAKAMESLRANVKKAGGTDAVEKSLGSGAIVVDPEGNYVGLIQLAPFAYGAFKRGQLAEGDLAETRDAFEAAKLMHRRR